MEFIETPIFVEEWARIGRGDHELLALQLRLLLQPDAGDVIPRSGGLRKIRVAAKGRGKRGGARVIHYWLRGPSQIFLLLAYAKNERDDLRSHQLRMLRDLIPR